jgi:chromobox protein 1
MLILPPRETAQTILDEYLAKVGGKEFLMEKLQGIKDEIAEKKQGKKRGRTSTGASTPQTSGKKSRRNGTHPASQAPPLAVKEAQFTPPSGSWEDKVVDIEAMAGTDNEVIVYLTWEGGHKSQHPLHQVYKRCPQRVSIPGYPRYCSRLTCNRCLDFTKNICL